MTAEHVTIVATAKCVAACRRVVLQWPRRAARNVLCTRKEVPAMFAHRQTPPGSLSSKPGDALRAPSGIWPQPVLRVPSNRCRPARISCRAGRPGPRQGSQVEIPDPGDAIPGGQGTGHQQVGHPSKVVQPFGNMTGRRRHVLHSASLGPGLVSKIDLSQSRERAAHAAGGQRGQDRFQTPAGSDAYRPNDGSRAAGRERATAAGSGCSRDLGLRQLSRGLLRANRAFAPHSRLI
jgi:hypothetical protein